MNNNVFNNLFREYLDIQNSLSDAESRLKNFCKDYWLKSHNWKNEDELKEFLIKKLHIDEEEKDFLDIYFKFVPSNRNPIVSPKRNKKYSRYFFGVNGVDFSQYLDGENKELEPTCIITFKDEYDMEIDYSGKKQYSIIPYSERQFTLLKISDNDYTYASILIFKNCGYESGNPIVGITEYPFNEGKEILYIDTKDYKTYGVNSSIKKEVIESIIEFIKLNDGTIERYWNDPDFTSKRLRDCLIYKGFISLPEDLRKSL